MNKYLKEAFLKQKIRQMHQRAYRSVLIEGGEHNLYTTFIQPFTDVIEAAKLTGQDVLNAMKLSFDMLTTMDPKKMEEAIQKFDSRKAKINEKWKPLMERTNEALSSGDADLLALVMAPGAYLLTEAAVAAYDNASSLHQYLSDAGWRIPFVGGLLKDPPKQSSVTKSSDKKNSSTLLGRLSTLFFGNDKSTQSEILNPEGKLILEQDEPTAKKEPDFKKALQKYFAETGLSKEFERDAKELLDIQKELTDEIVSQAVPKLSLITALTQTVDIDEFISTINNAENNGLDLQSAGLDEAKDSVIAAAAKLEKSEKFREKIAEEEGIKIDEDGEDLENSKMLDDKIKVAAKKVSFANAKQDFDKQMLTGYDQLKNEAILELEKNIPNEQNLNILKTTPIGLTFIKLIEDAKQKIQNA